MPPRRPDLTVHAQRPCAAFRPRNAVRAGGGGRTRRAAFCGHESTPKPSRHRWPSLPDPPPAKPSTAACPLLRRPPPCIRRRIAPHPRTRKTEHRGPLPPQAAAPMHPQTTRSARSKRTATSEPQAGVDGESFLRPSNHKIAGNITTAFSKQVISLIAIAAPNEFSALLPLT